MRMGRLEGGTRDKGEKGRVVIICKPSVEKWQAANISCELGGKLFLLLTGGLELFGLQLGQPNAKAVIFCQK